jgi:hypothetical protein
MEQNPSQDTLKEIYRLTHENNKMLHTMRRNAFWGGIFKVAMWIVVLVLAPLWLYSVYLAPLMQGMTQTLDRVRGTNTPLQGQLGTLESTLKNLQNTLPSFMQPKQ